MARRLLILGGTVFLGRAVAHEALERGYEVTLFHRGQTNPGLFPEANHVHGDRDGGLTPLYGGRWDAIVDTSGFVPRIVRDSAQSLAGCADFYSFVSTLSVYGDDDWPANFDETTPLEPPPPDREDTRAYGPLKALCEEEVAEAFPERSNAIRSGVIVGPHDRTDRLHWWLTRLPMGGEALAPGEESRLLKTIDVRDLAAFILTTTETGATGPFNATGPQSSTQTVGEVIVACRTATEGTATLIWCDDDFISSHGGARMSNPPLWLTARSAIGLGTTNVDRAYAAGLNCRPLTETVHDTLEWMNLAGDDLPRSGTWTIEREREVLAAFRS